LVRMLENRFSPTGGGANVGKNVIGTKKTGPTKYTSSRICTSDGREAEGILKKTQGLRGWGGNWLKKPHTKKTQQKGEERQRVKNRVLTQSKPVRRCHRRGSGISTRGSKALKQVPRWGPAVYRRKKQTGEGTAQVLRS